MKSTKQGFAAVGAVVVMVALLAGSAFIFRNAGTPDDMVAQTIRAATGRNISSAGYGSGGYPTTPGGCPRVCDDILTQEYAAYRVYYSYKEQADRYCAAYKSEPHQVWCKQYTDLAQQYATRATALTKQYLACVKKYNAYKVCQPAHQLPTIPTYNCAKLKAAAESLQKKNRDFENGLNQCLERETAKQGANVNGPQALTICRKTYPLNTHQAIADNFRAAVDRYNNSCGGNMSKGY